MKFLIEKTSDDDGLKGPPTPTATIEKGCPYPRLHPEGKYYSIEIQNIEELIALLNSIDTEDDAPEIVIQKSLGFPHETNIPYTIEIYDCYRE